MLRSKSVELHNTDLSSFRVAQEVVDDLHDEQERQEWYRPRGAKPYNSNLHDMVLWHFTKSRRRAIVESPLDATAWVVTLDYGLIKFDQRKGQGEPGPPICLHPSSLIQLFQFWVPSSTRLDEALVGSVRQPLLFLTFDYQSEQITARILKQLSRFEGAEDLDTDVATEILTNQALRDRLSHTSGDVSTDEQIIQEELFTYVQRLGDGMKALLSEHADDRNTIAQLENRVAGLGEASTKADKERAARVEADRTLAAETASRRHAEAENQRLVEVVARLGDLEDTNQKLRQQLDAQERRSVSRAENWQLSTLGSLAVLFASVVTGFGGLILDRWLQSGPAWFASTSVGIMILLFGLEFAARGTHFEQSFVVKHLPSVRSRWWTFVLSMLGTVIADRFLLV